ncbi:MAG: DUF2029 domain-containing protein, partial [Candidatus Lokiarchaeota archaeon]|nr:DUF2029 domain-containing protein [Candidatus Lokiarchaeota archaeon]
MDRQRWHILIIIAIHVIVYFLVNTSVLLRVWGAENNDFTLNYTRAVENFLSDPATLYNSPDPRMRMRTLPAVVLYYAIFHLISPTPSGGYLACVFWMVIWNIGSVLVLEKITTLEGFRSIQTRTFLKDPRVLSLFYLCYFWHSGEYYSGQPNVIAGFFVILGMYYALQSRTAMALFSWGIAMTFKLYPVFLILFFLLKSGKRDFFKNVLFIALSMLPNLLMFLAWPSLLFSFINENISTSLATTFSIFPSGSLARLLSIFLPVPFLALVVIVLITILPAIIISFLKHGDHMNIIDQAILSFTCGIVVFPDFYPGHSIILWGIFLLWLATNNNRINSILKTIYFI